MFWSSDATKYQKRNIDKFLWYIFISFIKWMTSIDLFVKYFLRFPHVYYTEDSNRSGLILLSHCVSLRFCNTLGAILLIAHLSSLKWSLLITIHPRSFLSSSTWALFKFLSSSPEPHGQFQPILVQNILGGKDSSEGDSSL